MMPIDAKILSGKTLSGLMGLCVGDALGVPVEFSSRAERTASPVTDMMGYGTWNQPLGTWSDDSSLTFCLAECLCDQEFSLEAIAQSFCRWRSEGDWTGRGTVFDIGGTTAIAIYRLHQGVSPLEAGETSSGTNGNGSLMRILPLAFCYKSLNFVALIDRVHQVSAITHAHPRSQIACGIYVSIAVCLLQGYKLEDAYLLGLRNVKHIYIQPQFITELSHFDRILSTRIAGLSVDEVRSSGYVIDTLEAALWCLLNTRSYAEAVLKAVNLGGDTDTTASVTGGLAGIYYGTDGIPAKWIEQIARKVDIIDLADRLAERLKL